MDYDKIEDKETEIRKSFNFLRDELSAFKPNDRSSLDRAWAITITEVEKAYAYWQTFAVAK